MAPPALLQVFRNLTTNAFQAMPTGGTLRLWLPDAIRPAGTILASVADTGPGLDARDAQAPVRAVLTRPRPEGTGLGLAIAREIALAHRGDLQAANRTDGYRCRLHAHAAGGPVRKQRRTPLMNTPATVLVADDDRTIRRNLVLLLQSEGYQTLEAADGDEALASIKAHDPDAVLLDLKMPGRDGLEVLAELGPALADLPVIVVTASGRLGRGHRGDAPGAYDYLTKPFDLDEVLLTLKRALRQREPWPFEVEALRRKEPTAMHSDAADDAGRCRARADRPERRDARGLQGDRPRRRDRRSRS